MLSLWSEYFNQTPEFNSFLEELIDTESAINNNMISRDVFDIEAHKEKRMEEFITIVASLEEGGILNDLIRIIFEYHEPTFNQSAQGVPILTLVNNNRIEKEKRSAPKQESKDKSISDFTKSAYKSLFDQKNTASCSSSSSSMSSGSSSSSSSSSISFIPTVSTATYLTTTTTSTTTTSGAIVYRYDSDSENKRTENKQTESKRHSR